MFTPANKSTIRSMRYSFLPVDYFQSGYFVFNNSLLDFGDTDHFNKSNIYQKIDLKQYKTIKVNIEVRTSCRLIIRQFFSVF